MYSRCIEYCNEALEIDAQNIKAMFRRARAHRLLENFDKAEVDLIKVKGIIRQNVDLLQVERELELLKQSQLEYHAASRQFAQRALGG